MKKENLEVGMKVITGDGWVYIVVVFIYKDARRLIFSREGGFMRGDEYCDDLTIKLSENNHKDIIKIYSKIDYSNLLTIDDDNSERELLWEREEEKGTALGDSAYCVQQHLAELKQENLELKHKKQPIKNNV